jgi:hypothetical protein
MAPHYDPRLFGIIIEPKESPEGEKVVEYVRPSDKRR